MLVLELVSTLLEILPEAHEEGYIDGWSWFQPFLRFYGRFGVYSAPAERGGVSTLLEILQTPQETPKTAPKAEMFQPFLRFYATKST